MRKSLFATLFLISFCSSAAWAYLSCEQLFESGIPHQIEAPSRGQDTLFEKSVIHMLESAPDIKALTAQIKPLPDPIQSLAAKVNLIRNAQKSIDVSYYIFKTDETGSLLIDELRKAAIRGVKIRILVDGAGSFKIFQSELGALLFGKNGQRRSNVEVKVINPLPNLSNTLQKFYDLFFKLNWRFSVRSINNRSHDKILLVDSGEDASFAVVGGRNVANSYYGMDKDGKNYFDYEILIKHPNNEGDFLQQVKTHFETLYYHQLNMTLSRLNWGVGVLSKKRALKQIIASKKAALNNEGLVKYIEQTRSAEFWTAGFDDSRALLVSEIENITKETLSGQKRSSRLSVMDSLGKVMMVAKRKIDIVTPYPIFTQKNIDLLIKKWLIDNPQGEMTIITNSSKSIDSLLVYAVFKFYTLPKLMKLQKDPRIGTRLRIFAYQKSELMHAKFIIADDEMSLTTTSNLDPRSQIHNSEIGIWTDSQLDIETKKTMIQQLISDSKSIDSISEMDEGLRASGFNRFKNLAAAYLIKSMQMLNLHLLF